MTPNICLYFCLLRALICMGVMRGCVAELGVHMTRELGFHQVSTTKSFPRSFSYRNSVTGNENRPISTRKFEICCAKNLDLDVSMSALAGGVAESLTVMEEANGKPEEPVEPSISTTLMNFSNEFDPYGAMSTPLYQTTTFKQSSQLNSALMTTLGVEIRLETH